MSTPQDSSQYYATLVTRLKLDPRLLQEVGDLRIFLVPSSFPGSTREQGSRGSTSQNSLPCSGLVTREYHTQAIAPQITFN
ncbi:MAG: hypothetical protein VKL59_02335, partial [Nostocaceae cyanobacterium]|nr:hypothetical protein [Nostocaceae cyanobacterium]